MSTILKSYKFQIEPNKAAREYLAQAFGSKRFINNHYLSIQQERFKNKEKHLSGFDVNKDITQLKKQEGFEWLNGIDDWILKNASADLDQAYQNFFNSLSGKRKGPKVEAPKFKKKSNRQSFRTTCKLDQESCTIKIPKLKKPIKYIPDGRQITGKIKTVTISKTPSGKYFASILVEEEQKLLPASGVEVGIDLGIKDLMILSSGLVFKNPRIILEKANRELKKQQKKLARKKKGSKNRERQRLKVARAYETLTNIKINYYHEISTYLVRNFDAIYMENLNVAGMKKNRKLSRAIHEASWSILVEMIDYKANWYGKTFHKIGRFVPSSKTCSCCGHKLDFLSLDVREWICPSCFVEHDRDFNAAVNILQYGQLDCYSKVIPSVATTEEGASLPVSLMKMTSKTERSVLTNTVGHGMEKTDGLKTHR